MKKLVAILVVIIVCIPSVAPAPQPNPYGLGRNAACVYKCFDTAPIVTAWLDVLKECFSLNSGDALSTASTDGTREAAINGIGPNAFCVDAFFIGNFRFPFFWECVQGNCFRQEQ
jgi:hypothetical protein